MKKKSAGKRNDSNESDPDAEKDDLDSPIEIKSEPSDESLEALLRDVVVPQGLTAKLMEIPVLGLESIDPTEGPILVNDLDLEEGGQQEGVVTLLPSEKRGGSGVSQHSRRLAIALSVVASVSVVIVALVGILVIGFMLSTGGNGNSLVGDSGSEKKSFKQKQMQSSDLTKQQTNDGKPFDSENTIDSQLQLQITAMDDAIESANLRVQELEIARLKAKLRLLKSNARPQISSREFESIALAVAAEATEDFGGSEELARMQYVSVIENYPSSLGSKIAIENLEGRLQ